MSDTPEGKEFAGFPAPTKNFFSLPNEMINIIAHITNLAELKVIIYVIRHTWGFHEYGIKKAITTDEFMHGRKRNDDMRMDEGTGLSNRSVIDGLRAAVEHGYLEYELDETDKARKVKSYALKMQSSQIDEMDVKKLHMEHDSGYEESSHQREGSSYQGEESSHQREGSSYRTEKDTIERHLEKDTKKKSVSTPPTESSPTQDTHTSFLNSSSSSSRDQVAETTATTTPQARSRAETAMSAPTPRTPDFPPSFSPQGVRGVFPLDDNVVGSPPATDKSQVNKPRLSKQELALHQKWAKAYLKDGTTKELLLKALALRKLWLTEYGTYGDTKWGDEALIWLAEQPDANWENVQKVYQLVPGETVTPEHVKNNWHRLNGKKKAPSPKSVSGRKRVEETDPAFAEYMALIKGGK